MISVGGPLTVRTESVDAVFALAETGLKTVDSEEGITGNGCSAAEVDVRECPELRGFAALGVKSADPRRCCCMMRLSSIRFFKSASLCVLSSLSWLSPIRGPRAMSRLEVVGLEC